MDIMIHRCYTVAIDIGKEKIKDARSELEIIDTTDADMLYIRLFETMKKERRCYEIEENDLYWPFFFSTLRFFS